MPVELYVFIGVLLLGAALGCIMAAWRDERRGPGHPRQRVERADQPPEPPGESTQDSNGRGEPAVSTDGAIRTAIFQSCGALLSPAERSFFEVLERALADRFRLLARVRLADVIQPVRGLHRSARQSAQMKLAGKQVDFVLCDRASFELAAVVQLDGRSQPRADRAPRDAFVEEALREAGLPLVRVMARENYSASELREVCLAAIKPGPGTEPLAAAA